MFESNVSQTSEGRKGYSKQNVGSIEKWIELRHMVFRRLTSEQTLLPCLTLRINKVFVIMISRTLAAAFISIRTHSSLF